MKISSNNLKLQKKTEQSHQGETIQEKDPNIHQHSQQDHSNHKPNIP